MLSKQRHINTIKELLSTDYTSCILNDYGSNGVNNLKMVLETIISIFKNINLHNFDSILVFKSDVFNLEEQVDNYLTIQNYIHLAGVEERSLVIQVKNLDEIVFSTSDIQTTDILPTDFVYQYTRQKEIFHTLTTTCVLPRIPGTDSCFTISTFKELDEALLHYKTSVAKYAECQHIKTAAHSDNRIFFKPHPEHFLRDSLVYFLRVRLRGEGLEVRPEQNVDTSHPVDVKITWGFTNHIALIEIKWLGKSLNQSTLTFTEYSASRARDGAEQLANYLEANKMQVPNHTTMGYLAIFDLRRRNANENTTQISVTDGFWFQNQEIVYNPEYHRIRSDFAMPIRMFITPQCLPDEN